MKVALIGVTGRVGSRIAKELLARGHEVTGIALQIPHPAPSDIAIVQADATKPKLIAPIIAGHGAVISASRFTSSSPNALIAALKQAGVKRLLVVGGAATLKTASGTELLNSPNFSESFKAEATAGAAFLAVLRQEHTLDWTFLSPSADFAPGKRTGHFRIGKDNLLTDANGKSWISMEDFAIAIVDELEKPEHTQQRFTVGY